MPVSTRGLREVAATRYVTALREGGSLPGLVEADDDGLYVVKFAGAGQGLRALVAEVIVGELARRAQLLVPELVTVSLDARLGAAEPDPEIQDLITGSQGRNLGVDFLPGALAYTPAGALQPSPEQAAEIVWLDALTTNVDRTARNPNLLLWHERLWLIDHGAALYLQHAGLDPIAHAQRPFPLISEHVLLPRAGSIMDADARMRARLGGDAVDAVEAVVGLVPGAWFAGADAPEVYAEYLKRRLAAGGFAQEAERARTRR
ncbi:MAG: HipA family kinase [Solirubrobacteraceae bacterium]